MPSDDIRARELVVMCIRGAENDDDAARRGQRHRGRGVAGRRGALVVGRRRREAADARDERAAQPEVLRGAVLLAVAP